MDLYIFFHKLCCPICLHKIFCCLQPYLIAFYIYVKVLNFKSLRLGILALLRISHPSYSILLSKRERFLRSVKSALHSHLIAVKSIITTLLLGQLCILYRFCKLFVSTNQYLLRPEHQFIQSKVANAIIWIESIITVLCIEILLLRFSVINARSACLIILHPFVPIKLLP